MEKVKRKKILPSQYHTLTIEQINAGVIAFLQVNDMNAGSSDGFDFYRLLQEYIKNEEKRRQINEIVIANIPEKSDFYLWLGKQLQRDDIIGDLARDVYDDSKHPKAEGDLSKLHDYLCSVNAISEAHCALDEAFEAFKAIPPKRNISLKDRFFVLKRDNYACKICGKSAADGVKLEVDHKIPISRGGSNAIDNLWVLCFDCNRGKREKAL